MIKKKMVKVSIYVPEDLLSTINNVHTQFPDNNFSQTILFLIRKGIKTR